MLQKRRYQMHRGHATRRWQQASEWFVILLLSAAAINLLPVITDARAWESTSGQPHNQLVDTPVPNPPIIIPTPNQGPVKTLVTLQGSDWPPDSQVLLSYDNDSSCTGPNLTELSPDPKPTVNSSGNFTASFSWPAVQTTGSWYICAATSDHAATGAAVFNVLSTSPPSLTILTKGPFMPGQTMVVQGQNWFPGGMFISFALQPAKSNASFPLEETVVSLFNGSFGPVSITIPLYLAPGKYTLVATMEQQALAAHSSSITIEAPPTPTPTATPSPSPTPHILATPTPHINHQQPPSTHQLSGTMLALVIISGSMALAFALIGGALLFYLMHKRSLARASSVSTPTMKQGR